MSNAVDVIAKTVRSLAGTNSSDDTFRAYAEVVIADLKAAGFTIVRPATAEEEAANTWC